jgi:hypothetical protein
MEARMKNLHKALLAFLLIIGFAFILESQSFKPVLFKLKDIKDVSKVDATDGQMLSYVAVTGLATWVTASGTGDMVEANWATGGLLKPAKGGTGLATIAANSYLKGNDTSALVPRTYAEVRTDLGLVIGTNVQAYDADLTTYAGITPSANAQALLAETFAQMLASIGAQAADSDLTTYAGITPSANAQTLLGETFAQMFTSLGAVPAASPIFTGTLTINEQTGRVIIGTSSDVIFGRDAANVLALRNVATQQIFRVYNTADAFGTLTNYERLTITGVAGTSLNITAETAGTGADNLDVIVTPAGTGAFKVAGPGGAVSGVFSISDASGDLFTQTVGVMAAAQTLTWTPAANQIQMDLGTTQFIVSADCTLDQNLAIASTPTFAGVYKKIIPVNSGNNATVDLTAAGTCLGQIYTNAGNDSDTHYDLPAAVVGMSMTFFVTDAFTITVDPNGNDRIIGTSANGDYLQGAATIGNMLALVCVKANEWQTVGKNGTWTEE